MRKYAKLAMLFLLWGCGAAPLPIVVPAGGCSLRITSTNASYEGATIVFYQRSEKKQFARFGKYPESSVLFNDEQPWLPAKLLVDTGRGRHMLELQSRSCSEEFNVLTGEKGWPFLRNTRDGQLIFPEHYSSNMNPRRSPWVVRGQ